jgi:hypothetical protein
VGPVPGGRARRVAGQSNWQVFAGRLSKAARAFDWRHFLREVGEALEACEHTSAIEVGPAWFIASAVKCSVATPSRRSRNPLRPWRAPGAP